MPGRKPPGRGHLRGTSAERRGGYPAFTESKGRFPSPNGKKTGMYPPEEAIVHVQRYRMGASAERFPMGYDHVGHRGAGNSRGRIGLSREREETRAEPGQEIRRDTPLASPPPEGRRRRGIVSKGLLSALGAGPEVRGSGGPFPWSAVPPAFGGPPPPRPGDRSPRSARGGPRRPPSREPRSHAKGVPADSACNAPGRGG